MRIIDIGGYSSSILDQLSQAWFTGVTARNDDVLWTGTTERHCTMPKAECDLFNQIVKEGH